MKRWLITPEGSQPFTVDADTEQQALLEAEDLTNWDIVAIYEVDLFDVISGRPIDNGLDIVA